MLYLGMVLVVESSSLDPLYKDLPVIIVDEWSHLCDRSIAARYYNLRDKVPVREEVFTLEYWLTQR